MTVEVRTRDELRQAVNDKRVVILVKGRELAEFVYFRKRRYRWMLFLCILCLVATVGFAFAAQGMAETTVVELIGPELFLSLSTAILGFGVVIGLVFAAMAFMNPYRSYRYIKRTLLWAVIHRV